MSINEKQVIVNRERAKHLYGAGGHRKIKKTTKRTHFPVTRLPMVTYREFSRFWYIKLLQFLLGIHGTPPAGWVYHSILRRPFQAPPPDRVGRAAANFPEAAAGAPAQADMVPHPQGGFMILS